MQTGTKISAAGHGALVFLALFGLPWFGPRERDAVRVTEVSFVSEAEFAAAQSAAPEAPRNLEAPSKPAAARQMPEVSVESEVTASQDQGQPAAPESPMPEETPRVVTSEPPTAAQPPRARPVQRVQPVPSPPTDQDVRLAETAKPVTSPEPAAVSKETEAPAVQPEAAPETSPEEIPPAVLALETSGRPHSRPEKVAERTTQPTPAAKPTRTVGATTAEPETVMRQIKREVDKEVKRRATPATPSTAPTVTAATEPSSESETSLPVGPPMTSSEKNGLKLAVQRCWNVPAGLRDAQELKVTLAAELQPNGQVINASIRLVEPSNPDARFKSAYEAGRRALIRCSPYADLPREKYAQWRNIEVVFNPEGMVSW